MKNIWLLLLLLVMPTAESLASARKRGRGDEAPTASATPRGAKYTDKQKKDAIEEKRFCKHCEQIIWSQWDMPDHTRKCLRTIAKRASTEETSTGGGGSGAAVGEGDGGGGSGWEEAPAVVVLNCLYCQAPFTPVCDYENICIDCSNHFSNLSDLDESDNGDHGDDGGGVAATAATKKASRKRNRKDKAPTKIKTLDPSPLDDKSTAAEKAPQEKKQRLSSVINKMREGKDAAAIRCGVKRSKGNVCTFIIYDIDGYSKHLEGKMHNFKNGSDKHTKKLYKRFPLKKEILKIEEKEVEGYICRWCEYFAEGISDIKKHERIHTNVKPFICTICSYQTTDPSTLRKHSNIHLPVKPFPCYLCDYRGARKSHLNDHMRRHTGEKPFKCSKCNYRAHVKNGLKNHAHHHTEQKWLFKCDTCTYGSNDKDRIAEHKKLDHTTQADDAIKE